MIGMFVIVHANDNVGANLLYNGRDICTKCRTRIWAWMAPATRRIVCIARRSIRFGVPGGRCSRHVRIIKVRVPRMVQCIAVAEKDDPLRLRPEQCRSGHRLTYAGLRTKAKVPIR